MSFIEVAGKQIETNEEGFLKKPGEWDANVAVSLATQEEGIQELTEDHWSVINYIRDYYQQYGIAPMIRKLCKDTGFNLKYIYELFPSGPAKGACKLAGLAKPTGCV